MHKQIIKVELLGGVGNQLFQYFAGKALSIETNSILKVDTSQVGLNGTLQESDLSLLNLECEFTHSRKKRILKGSAVARVHNRLQRQFYKYNYLTSRMTNRYQANGLGFESALLEARPPVTISGYFQTRKYFDMVNKSSHIEVELLKPSEWFNRQQDVLRDKRVVSLHVRRGDYQNLKDTFGLLSAKYYHDALSALRDKVEFDEAWVFSDDPKLASQLLRNLPDLVFVNPPPESNAVESLLLMSKCKAQIISNSTFAWWAALLNPKGNTVCPAQWFKNHPYSEDLILSEWIPIQSSWED
jgi:hypothetical protein